VVRKLWRWILHETAPTEVVAVEAVAEGEEPMEVAVEVEVTAVAVVEEEEEEAAEPMP
jgi:hypothetical protein